MYTKTFLLSALIPLAASHMQVKSPPPRNSPFGTSSNPDYSYTSPLNADGSNFPCKGYAKGTSVKTVQAGGTVDVEVVGGAVHNGGHCQFALSYDDKSWVVLKTVADNCFFDGSAIDSQTYKWSITIPASAPACTDCTLSWNWINAVGNAEYYQNCIDISITSSSAGSIEGPQLFVANLPTYPRMADFAGSADTGKCYLDQRPSINIGPGVAGSGVYGSGATCSGSGGNAPTVAAPTQLTTTKTTSTTTTTTTVQGGANPTQPSITTIGLSVPPTISTRTRRRKTVTITVFGPQPTSPSTPSTIKCTQETMECASTTTFRQCTAAGVWVEQGCAKNTVCLMGEKGVYCGFA